MKKVEIITLHYIRNYGSVLQTYATQKKFELMGYKTEVVDYVRPNVKESVMIKEGMDNKGINNNYIKKVIYIVIKKLENKKRNSVCDNFLNKYVHMSKHYNDYNALKKNPPIADIYCTGSDQTWNSEYNGGILPAYYLKFSPENSIKIGYSVSIGMDSIPNNERDTMSEFIKEYKAISVREKSAQNILKDLGYDNAEHIIDPTLVLNKNEWSNLVAPRMINEKYIIIYKLNNNDNMEKYASDLAEKTKCKIVRMSYYLNHHRYKGKMKFTPSVEQFLSLIYYADYVITDSFHCTAFSLNFKKEFFVFYPGKYNTRLQSVLELTGTEHRVMNNNANVKKIDYDYVEKILERERNKATRFIEMNCN